jgi:hypothetical protein
MCVRHARRPFLRASVYVAMDVVPGRLTRVGQQSRTGLSEEGCRGGKFLLTKFRHED